MSHQWYLVLAAAVLFVPIGGIASQFSSVRHNLRAAVLAGSYVLFLLNEIGLTLLGKSFHVYHLYLDGLLLSVAMLAIINRESNRLRIPPEFVFHFVFLYLVMFGMAPLLPLASAANMSLLTGVLLAAVFLFLVVVVAQSKIKGQRYAVLAAVLWLFAHLIMYQQPPWLNRYISVLFFGVLGFGVTWQCFLAGKDMFFENTFLFRSQHVVLSMLNDISSSAEYISSVDKTLGRILETVMETLSASGAVLYVLESPADKEPYLKFSQASGKFFPLHHVDENSLKYQQLILDRMVEAQFHLGEGLVGAVAEKQKPMILERTEHKTDMMVLGLDHHHIRSIIAVPMRLKGSLYGVIVAQNAKERACFDQNDAHLLQSLADQAGISVNSTHMYVELTNTVRFREEANIATRIQEQLLPGKVPVLANLNLAVFFVPAKEVGGDYYDFIPHQDGSLGIVIGDVSGKGVPAGMVMAVAKALVQMIAKLTSSPGEIVTKFGLEMYGNMRSGQFMTFNYVRWDDAQRKLTFAGAGHEYVLWFHNKTGRSDKIRAGGLAIGLAKDMAEYVTEQSLQLERGDVVLLYTDGVTEARSPTKEMFTLRRLQAALESNAYLVNPDKIRENVIRELQSFMAGADQYDDITMLVLSVVA
jgi:serine phosphatase RsbU (regulator of sigma subunit)